MCTVDGSCLILENKLVGLGPFRSVLGPECLLVEVGLG